MELSDHIRDKNESYYPEVIIVFGFLLSIGCVVGLAIGMACTRSIPW